MAERRNSLAGRALVMLALFIGFYLLAIVVAVALIAAPVLEIVFAERLHGQLLLLSLVGLAILWSLVPRRRQRWVDPGPRFTAEEEPELAALVRRVADAVGQPMPDELYLLDDLNAFVTTRGGFMGFGGRRVLAVGVPLLMVLDAEELASVLAHEFGHFHGGDTRLLPLVYRSRDTMGRTLNVATGFVQGILKAYAAFYLARTQGISRAQESAADRLAARVTSAEAAAAALARLPVAGTAFAYYRASEYGPVLTSGRQPAYLGGYQAMLEHVTAGYGPGLTADVAFGAQTQSRFDSHPSPAERIRALGVDPQGLVVRPQASQPATALLRDPEGVQAALVARHTGGGVPADRAPIGWDDVGMQVLVPRWRASVTGQLLPAAPGLVPAAVPIGADDLADLGTSVYRHAGATATRPERENAARMLCGQYLAVAAVDAGWSVESLPGYPVRFLRDGQAWDLFGDYTRVCGGEFDPAAWHARLQAAGLADVTSGAGGHTGVATSHGAGGHATAASAASSDPAPALATAVTEAPAAPLRYRGTPMLRRELVIDGTTLRWGDREIDAGDVTAVGYRVVNNQWDIRFATPDGELRLKVSTGKKASAAVSAVLRWSELYVAPRLVDDLLARFDQTGSVEIDGVAFTAEGIMPRKGRLVPWAEFAGTSFADTHVTLHRRADNLDGHARVGAVNTVIKSGGVLVPPLCRAIRASRG